MPPALEAWSRNYWTTREVQNSLVLYFVLAKVTCWPNLFLMTERKKTVLICKLSVERMNHFWSRGQTYVLLVFSSLMLLLYLEKNSVFLFFLFFFKLFLGAMYTCSIPGHHEAEQTGWRISSWPASASWEQRRLSITQDRVWQGVYANLKEENTGSGGMAIISEQKENIWILLYPFVREPGKNRK